MQQRVQICGGHVRFTQGRLGGPEAGEGTAPQMASAGMRAARTHPRTCAAHGSRRAMAPFRAPQRHAPSVRKPMHMSHALPELASAVQGADDSKQLATYAGLGLAAASFVVTFFVLPQFRDLLKEPVQWSDIYKALVQAGNVKSLPPSDAYARAKRGAVLLDVRLAQRYDDSHAERAVSAPLYRPIEGWDVPSTLRRVAFSLFGIFPGTELNPDFLSTVQAAASKGKEVIVLCESGGSLDNKPGTKYGFQSRSLKAAYFLQQAGYNKVSYCQGGYPQWQREGLPVVSGSDDSAGDDGEEAVAVTAGRGRLFGR